MDGLVPIEEVETHVGSNIRIQGIVDDMQDHGGLVFMIIGDMKNFIKALIIPDRNHVYQLAREVKLGYLVEVEGLVRSCPLSAQGGGCEVEVERLSIISARTKLANVMKLVSRK